MKGDEVLAAKDPFQPWYPASLTKLMTAYIAFEALRDGKITIEGKPVNKLFINGEFVDARSGKTFATINPATIQEAVGLEAEQPGEGGVEQCTGRV